MSVRKTLFALAGLVLSVGAPASGEEGAGVSTQVAGTVYAYSQQPPVDPAPRLGSEELVGHLVLDGRWQYEFVGNATAYSTSSRQPELTAIECWMEAVDGYPVGPHVLAYCPGATCTGGGTAGPWYPEGVKICLYAQAVFGPLNPVWKTIGPTCSTSLLN